MYENKVQVHNFFFFKPAFAYCQFFYLPICSLQITIYVNKIKLILDSNLLIASD